MDKSTDFSHVNLTPEILTSIDSAVTVTNDETDCFILKYKGKIFNEGGTSVRLYKNEGAAKRTVTNLVNRTFQHGGYWQTCASQVKKRSGKDIDFSATINIINPYGLTSRWDEKSFKDMVKRLSQQLLETGVFTIEKV